MGREAVSLADMGDALRAFYLPQLVERLNSHSVLLRWLPISRRWYKRLAASVVLEVPHRTSRVVHRDGRRWLVIPAVARLPRLRMQWR